MQGGVGDFTREIGLALNRLGATVHVVSSVKAAPAFATPLNAEGGTSLSRDDRQLALYPVIQRWDSSCWSAIARLLRQTGSQILNVQYQTAGYQMRPAINFLPWRLRLVKERPKVVVTFHDLRLPYLFPKAGPLRRWVTKALIRGSDATIVTNVEDRIEAEGYGATNLQLFPIGSNVEPQAPPGYDRWEWRERWGIGPDEVLLCYFGFLNESKGAEILLRALAQLRASGEMTKLLMIGGKVGSSDPSNVAYLQKVEGLEVSASFWASDICVLPYRDGVSFRRGTLMAALAHGMPIVSTQPQVEDPEIAEGVNMSLAPPNDPEALAVKIHEVATSEELRRRLARGAAELAKMFSWESIAESTLRLYERMLSASD